MLKVRFNMRPSMLLHVLNLQLYYTILLYHTVLHYSFVLYFANHKVVDLIVKNTYLVTPDICLEDMTLLSVQKPIMKASRKKSLQ